MTEDDLNRMAVEEFEIAFMRVRCLSDGSPLLRASESERQLREKREQIESAWSHKAGTAQTHDRTESSTTLSRMYFSGDIDQEQFAAGEQISAVYELIQRDVSVRVVSYEPRIDCSASGRDMLVEGILMVRREMAYGWWRERIRKPRQAILDMIVGEPQSLSKVARRYRIGKKRAKDILIHSLDLWSDACAWSEKQVDAAELAAAHAGLL